MEWYKRFVLFAPLLALFNSCNKNSDVIEIAKVLQSHSWHLHQTRKLSYRSSAAGYQLVQDTTYQPNACDGKTTYIFLSNHSFTINDDCYVHLSGTGKWLLSDKNYLTATVQHTALQPTPGGQTYYTGIAGAVSAVEAAGFTVKQNSVFLNFNSSGTFQDSVVSIATYKQ